MKGTFAILAALVGAVMLAGPAAADHTPAGGPPDYKPQKYYWHEDCMAAPGNNLKCVKVRQMITWGRDEDFDKIYVTLGNDNKDWCGASRVSGGGHWGITSFQFGVNDGHTPTITRYYVLPAGCQYRFHFRHDGSDVAPNDTFNISISAETSQNDFCFKWDMEDWETTMQNCPSRWPGDSGAATYPTPLE